jgi:hypothetical protein
MIRVPNNVYTFATQRSCEDLMEKWVDYVNHFRAEFQNKKCTYDTSKSFADKTNKLHEDIEAKILEIAGANTTNFSNAVWNRNPMFVWATFAVIGNMIDAILPDTILSDFDKFAEVKSGGYGDSFAFDIKPTDLFVVTKAGHARRHAFAQRQFNGQATLIPENRIVTAEEDLYRVLAGKRNLAEYALKIVRSFEEEMSLDIYNAINDTYSALPSQFKEASYTQDSFVTLCQRVAAFNGGAKPIAFGTKLALSTIVPADAFKYGLGERYIQAGYFGDYMGTSLFELPQKANWSSSTYAMRMDDTRIYIISASVDKLIKVAIEGETLSIVETGTANANLTQVQTMHKKWKVGLISGAYFGIIDTGA